MQQICAVPEHCIGAGKLMTPGALPLPPTSGPSTPAGSAVIFASAVGVTRIWPAFGVRFAETNPPGIGSIPQPLQPPPPQPAARKTAVSTTNQSIRARIIGPPRREVSLDTPRMVKREPHTPDRYALNRDRPVRPDC